MRPTNPAAQAFSVEDLTQITGLGRSTLYEEIRAGRLLTRKVGSRTLVLAEDLEKFLQGLPEGGNHQKSSESPGRARAKKKPRLHNMSFVEPVSAKGNRKRARQHEERQPEELKAAPENTTKAAKMQLARDDFPELPPSLRRARA